MGNMDTANDNESPKSYKKTTCETSDSDSDYEPEIDEMFDNGETYKEFLNSLFPSKYLQDKILKESKDKKSNKSTKSTKSTKATKATKARKVRKVRKANEANESDEADEANVETDDENLQKAFKVLTTNSGKFPSDEDELLDEQDDIELGKNNFSIIYTFGENDKVVNTKVLQDGEYFEEMDDLEDICEISSDDEKDDKDEMEEDWEKVFRLEKAQTKKKKLAKNKFISGVKVGDKIGVKNQIG